MTASPRPRSGSRATTSTCATPTPASTAARSLPRSDLNLDHVVPRAQGGRTTWENVVCCCIDCNLSKGARTPVQAGLKLLKTPVAPPLDADLPHQRRPGPLPRVAAVPRPGRRVVLERRARRLAHGGRGRRRRRAHRRHRGDGPDFGRDRGVDAAPGEPVDEPVSEPVGDPVATGRRALRRAVERSLRRKLRRIFRRTLGGDEAACPTRGCVSSRSPRGAAGPGDRCWRRTSPSTWRRRRRRSSPSTPIRRADRCTSCSGAARPPRGFGEFLRGKAPSLNELIVDTPIAGVGLIGGEGSTFGASRPKQTAKGTLAAIAALDVDYVIVDLGPADSTLDDRPVAGRRRPGAGHPPRSGVDRFHLSVRQERVRPPPAHRARPRPPGEQRDRPAARRARSLPRGSARRAARTEKLEQEIRRYRPMFVVNQTRTVRTSSSAPGSPRRRGGGSDTPSTISVTSSRTRRSGWPRGAIARWSPSIPRGRPRRTSSGWGGVCCHWKMSAIAR